MSAACFVVQSCLADADFVVFSNYCFIGTRLNGCLFSLCTLFSLVGFGEERVQNAGVELLGIFLEALGEILGHDLLGNHQFHLQDGLALVVVERERDRVGPVAARLDVGLDLRAALELLVEDRDVLVGAQAHRVGKARLADRAVVQALFRDGVEPVVRKRQMLRLDQIAQAFGKVKKVDAVVAHRQLLHGLEPPRPIAHLLG